MARWFVAGLLLTCIAGGTARAAGQYLDVTFPASDKDGELQLGVTYSLWIPDGVKSIRGIIVHQHGCGREACKAGATATYDLHWQALAKKWDCALFGASYHQEDTQNCRLWCDPRNGSQKTFLKALEEFARLTKRPKLTSAPWCLWGHSGGAFWSSIMQAMYPERIVAIWLRSGTAFPAWEKGEIPRMEIPAAAYGIPMMLNPGAKENGDKRFSSAWTGSLAMFKAFRAKGALVGFAPDPRTAHECGDSRYLAIPFFDACLALRLPDKNAKDGKLKPIDAKTGYFAKLLGDKAMSAANFKGKFEEAVWLPNESVSKAWSEYVKAGATSDTTPPPAPTKLRYSIGKEGAAVELTWDAEADIESGIQAFVVDRNGKEIGKLPEKPVGTFGRPLFQRMSYHDTPEKPLPVMRFLDRNVEKGQTYTYRVYTINSVGLKSAASVELIVEVP